MHRLLSRQTHAFLDYLLGVLVVISPWVCGFAREKLAPEIAVTLGSAMLLYSLFTDYELGLIRTLPFAGNRFLDVLIGVGLGASFIHFRMIGWAGWVFALLGLLTLVNAFFTVRPKDPVPGNNS